MDRGDVDNSDKSDGSDLTTRSVVRDASVRSAMCPPFVAVTQRSLGVEILCDY
jgi:hypothetical protein